MLTQNYQWSVLLQMICFIRGYDFDQPGAQKNLPWRRFYKRVTNVFRFPKTGIVRRHAQPWMVFPQALPEIKNGKVTDYKKGVKKKNLSLVLEF
jgi:hypothetical protein